MTSGLQRYGTGHHATGVTQFALLPGSIVLLFQNGAAYWYTAEKPGVAHVDRMRALAVRGSGLSTYVSQHVGAQYAAKLSAVEVAMLREGAD